MILDIVGQKVRSEFKGAIIVTVPNLSKEALTQLVRAPDLAEEQSKGLQGHEALDCQWRPSTENTGLATRRHFFAGNLTLTECGFSALNFPNIIMTLMSYNEFGRKEFYTDYTLFLGLTWSDKPLMKEDYSLA